MGQKLQRREDGLALLKRKITRIWSNLQVQLYNNFDDGTAAVEKLMGRVALESNPFYKLGFTNPCR